MFGLSENIIINLKTIFSEYENVEKVVIYGSRAKGNYRTGSDIDLTFFGENLKLNEIYSIEEEIENLDLPYMFDLSIFLHIDNESLIDHILCKGKVFYQKEV